MSDLPDLPVLRFLKALNGVGANWCEATPQNPKSLRRAFPEGTTGKAVLAKMRSLVHRRLVNGCTCGCAGDFTLTVKGERALATPTP